MDDDLSIASDALKAEIDALRLMAGNTAVSRLTDYASLSNNQVTYTHPFGGTAWSNSLFTQYQSGLHYAVFEEDLNRLPPETEEPPLLEQMLSLYTAFMATGNTAIVPHVVGPPGTGKSSLFGRLADITGAKLHIVNASRISPLELEGVQMPVDTHNTDDVRLKLLHSPLWTQLKDGDIVVWEEFLRAFPEVYNGLLDIFTSREVAGLQLPKVFFVATSNSVKTYDSALEDRLEHIPVPDIRTNKRARLDLVDTLMSELNLHPRMKTSSSLNDMIDRCILPMYSLLDSFKPGAKRVAPNALNGMSARKLSGQARLRIVKEPALAAVIRENNLVSLHDSYFQYYRVLPGEHTDARAAKGIASLQGSDKLTPLQREENELNIQFMDMAAVTAAVNEKEKADESDDIFAL